MRLLTGAIVVLAIAGVAAQPRADLDAIAEHPALVAGLAPFHAYISTASALPARDRELLILRIAALSRSEVVFSAHGQIARAAGLGPADLTRLTGGRGAPGWNAFDAALVAAADELHAASFVSDATWNALAARYERRQMMDAVFTVAHYSMWASTLNSIGAAPGTNALFAGGRPDPGQRDHQPLAAPRIPPLEPESWTPEVRTMLDPSGRGRPVANVYRTYAQHPALYAPRQVLSEYIRTGSTLTPRVREMLILRIGFLCRSAYEWAAHARAGRAAGLSPDEIQRIAEGPAAGWSADDAALLQAVDELFNDDRVAPATWARLGARLDRRQLLDLLITAGGYRMVSMSLNTFGVPPEPDSEALPTSRR